MEITVIKGKQTDRLTVDIESYTDLSAESSVLQHLRKEIAAHGVFAENDLITGAIIKEKDAFLRAWRTVRTSQEKVRFGPYDIARFVSAHKHGYQHGETYETALHEIKDLGHKYTHWVWYVFPQQKGVGQHTEVSLRFALDGLEEAKAFLENEQLNAHLREITTAVLQWKGQRTAVQLMGSHLDALKLRSSMQLFNLVSPDDIFAQVLEAFFSPGWDE